LRIRDVGVRQRRSDGVRQAWTAIYHLQDKACSTHMIAIIIDPRPKADLTIRRGGFAGIQEQVEGDLTSLGCCNTNSSLDATIPSQSKPSSRYLWLDQNPKIVQIPPRELAAVWRHPMEGQDGIDDVPYAP